MSRKGHPNELRYVFIDDSSLLPSAPGVTGDLVNVAMWFWDTNALAWVKATGGSATGANVNVTNFPAVYPSTVADGANVAQGTTTDVSGTPTTIGLLKQIAAAGPGGGSGAGSVNVLGQVHVLIDNQPISVTGAAGGSSGGSVVVLNQITALITGTPTVLQGGAPWQIAGSVAATQGGTWNVGINGTPTVLQGGAPWQVAGSMAATQGGIWNVGINSQMPITAAQFGLSSVTPGQKTMAASAPVVIASDQTAIPVSFAPSATPSSTFVSGAFGSVNVLNTVTTLISGVPTVDVRAVGLSSVSVVGNVSALILAGTASMGSVNISGGVVQVISGGNTLGSVNVGGGTMSIIGGGIASGAPATANPLPSGGQATLTNPAAVPDGSMVERQLDQLGKTVTYPFAVRALMQQGGSTTSGTGETTFIAAGSNTQYHDLSVLMLSNLGSMTTPTVTIRDKIAGAPIFKVQLGVFQTVTLPFSRPWEQQTPGNAWTMQLNVAGGSVFVSGQAVKLI